MAVLLRDRIENNGDLKVCVFEISESNKDDGFATNVTDYYFPMDRSFLNSIEASTILASAGAFFLLLDCFV